MKTKRELEDAIVILKERRLLYLKYLDLKRSEEDWHGVMDASADLREIDRDIKVWEFFLGEIYSS